MYDPIKMLKDLAEDIGLNTQTKIQYLQDINKKSQDLLLGDGNVEKVESDLLPEQHYYGYQVKVKDKKKTKNPFESFLQKITDYSITFHDNFPKHIVVSVSTKIDTLYSSLFQYSKEELKNHFKKIASDDEEAGFLPGQLGLSDMDIINQITMFPHRSKVLNHGEIELILRREKERQIKAKRILESDTDKISNLYPIRVARHMMGRLGKMEQMFLTDEVFAIAYNKAYVSTYLNKEGSRQGSNIPPAKYLFSPAPEAILIYNILRNYFVSQ